MNERGEWQGADALYFIVYILISLGVTVAVFWFPQRLLTSAIQPIEMDAAIMKERVSNQLRDVDSFVGWQRGALSKRPLGEVMGTFRPSAKRFGMRVGRGSEEWYHAEEGKRLYDATVKLKPEGVKVFDGSVIVGSQVVQVSQAYPEQYESFG